MATPELNNKLVLRITIQNPRGQYHLTHLLHLLICCVPFFHFLRNPIVPLVILVLTFMAPLRLFSTAFKTLNVCSANCTSKCFGNMRHLGSSCQSITNRFNHLNDLKYLSSKVANTGNDVHRCLKLYFYAFMYFSGYMHF